MKKASLSVIALFLLLYIVPLGVRPIVIPDECRYAEIAREMISSGDWVVPHLNGLRYFEKPVLGYWLNAVSMTLLGENAFGLRFPSAMAVGISALMIFMLVRRFTGGNSTGILAATVFLTCLEVFGVGTFCVLDSVLSMFVTAAMVAFFFAYMEDTPRKKVGLLALVGVFCGLAFLAKGFIAFAVPVVAVLPFMIWEGRWKELFRIPWVPIVFAALVVLPWSALIHLREPDFWHYFFWTEHVKRFMSDQPQHPHPFWYYIPVLVGGALPWTALFPAVISGVRNTRLKDPLVRFAVCWFLLPFVFFSLSHGKIGTYILPCFPPLAILITIGLRKYLEREKKRAFTLGASFLALVTAMLAVILIVSQVTCFPGLRAYGPEETWKWVVGVIGFLTWTALSVLALMSQDSRKKLALYCAAPLLFMFIAHFVMPDQSIERKSPGEFLLRHADRIKKDMFLVSGDDPLRAVCWFYKRDDIYLLRAPGELKYGLSYDDSKHRLLSLDQLTEMVKAQEEKRVVLIAKARRYAEYKHLLPRPVFEDTNGRFVFVRF